MISTAWIWTLMSAIQEDDTSTALELLACERLQADLDEPVGPLRITALQLAAWRGSTTLLERLCESGADPNTVDKIGRCALFHAAHRGNVEAVRCLLTRGSFLEYRTGIDACILAASGATSISMTLASIGRDLPIPECWGRTPLHQAVKLNHSNVVRLLVDAGANVNAEDERRLTPVLLAGSNVNSDDSEEISKYIEIVDVLVSAKASTNVIHPDTGSTALHHATTLDTSVAVKRLLEGGACPLFQCTSTGITPLHIAAGSGNTETLLLLLGEIQPEYIDVRDKVNRTSLHRACYQGHRECARALIDHGSNLAAETKTGVTAIDAIFVHVPRPLAFLTDILDSRVRPIGMPKSDTEEHVIVDFQVLAPLGELQTSVIIALIAAASTTEQLTILQHPLIETFLRLKWARLRGFFFLFVLVHLFFVLSLSAYAVSLLRNTDRTLSRVVLTVCSSTLLLHCIGEILMLPRHYLRQFETWLSFISVTISLSISLVVNDFSNVLDNSGEERPRVVPQPPKWALQSISVAILLGWTQMMLLVGRFPTWGYYALMFSTVLKNVLKVLLAFVCLIVGFALSFAVLFDGNDQFRDSWRAVVKTVVMMMGEYEYEDLFAAGRDERSFLPATSRIVFLAFVMLASIVLMNLMIGLAVNDIQGLEREGHIRRSVKQAEFVAHLERITSHRIFRSELLHPRLRTLIASRSVVSTKLTLHFNNNYFDDLSRGITNELRDALFSLASKKQRVQEAALFDAKSRSGDTNLVPLLLNLERQLRRLKICEVSTKNYYNTYSRRLTMPEGKRRSR